MDVKIKYLNNYNTSLLKDIIDVDSNGFDTTTQTVFSMEEFARFGKIFLLYENDILIGVSEFLKDWNDNKRAYLYGIAISKNKQNMGFGTKFMKAIINKLKEYNIEKIVLYANPDNKLALHFYKNKFGFREIEYSKNINDKSKNRLLLELNI